ncbi:helix-turn-helix transcriptional regulator [Rhizobium sp. BK176]|uniref:helix-turn-helix domain-containing protein n=1 Tax=Rhizobium sp. BK176 TaxID=2587071 RepID=UPI002167338A|nr:helix-turn-helix transcriptional regulator [Rhizobium sp. BK176]
MKEARTTAGHKSMRSAAEALGIPLPTYNKHENGERNPGPEECIAYGRLFGVNPAWLMFGDEYVSSDGSPVAALPVSPVPLAGEDVVVAGVERNGKALRIVTSRGLRSEDEAPLLSALIEIVRPK